MAGSKRNAFENLLLQLIFNNTTIPNIGNAAGLQPSGVAGNFHIALFTVAPSDDSDGTEASYTGYARVAVARTSSGWSITDNVCENTEAITFEECTAGSATIVGAGIMTAATGGDMLFWTNDPNLAVSAGITPEFAVGDFSITED